LTVITVSITESPVQKVAGIPLTIDLSTNIAATIFYTLDGTTPTILSDIYITTIEMPLDVGRVTLKAFATDGVNISSVVTEEYGTTVIGDRFPHAAVSTQTQGYASLNLFPFGDVSPEPHVTYGNVGGVTVDDPDVTGIPDGFDGTATGTHADQTDLEYRLHNYEVIYSETNSKGEYSQFVGTLPATVTIRVPPPAPGYSEVDDALFNHNALVIYQDGTKEPYDPNITHVNKQFFSLGNDETVRDGSNYRTTALEGANITGSMTSYFYNPREDTYTFYYRDSESNRWIISKEPNRTASNISALRNMQMPSSGREGTKVFRWIPFKGSRLI
jgi:hypothetical protein